MASSIGSGFQIYCNTNEGLKGLTDGLHELAKKDPKNEDYKNEALRLRVLLQFADDLLIQGGTVNHLGQIVSPIDFENSVYANLPDLKKHFSNLKLRFSDVENSSLYSANSVFRASKIGAFPLVQNLGDPDSLMEKMARENQAIRIQPGTIVNEDEIYGTYLTTKAQKEFKDFEGIKLFREAFQLIVTNEFQPAKFWAPYTELMAIEKQLITSNDMSVIGSLSPDAFTRYGASENVSVGQDNVFGFNQPDFAGAKEIIPLLVFS